MNLFNQQQQQQQPFPNNNYQLPFNQSGTNQFNTGAGTTGNGFGNTSLTGNNSIFPQGGNNNLFNANPQNTPIGGTGGGNAWNNQPQNQPNTNNNLFRSSTMPSSLFPGPAINSNTNNTTGGAPNMFQTNTGGNNPNLFRSNTMMNSSTNNTTGFLNPNSSLTNNTGNNAGFNNNLFNTNNDQSRGHSYNTRNSVLPPFGDKGTINIKYMPKKNAENLLVCSITSAKEIKDKSLDELRAEDYAIIKAGQVPENIKLAIQRNVQLSEGLSGNLPNNMMMASNNNPTPNNMFPNQGGMNSSIGGSNMINQNSATNSLFTNNSNNINTMQRNGGWPTINSNNSAGNGNPFQTQNTISNQNSAPNFGGNNQGMNNSNPFNPNSNSNNPFNNQQSQGGAGQNFFRNGNQQNQPTNAFFNPNSNNSTNNQLFNGPSRFPTQNPTFTLNPGQPNNPFASNNNNNAPMNPFNNKPGPSFLPTNQQQQQQQQQQPGVPNLFPNSGTNSAFPNTNQGFMPNQSQGPSFLPQQQFQQGGGNGFMPNNNGLAGTNPQVFSLTNGNPHLFPQNPQMGGPGGFPGQFNNQFNQNFSQQGMGMGMQYPSQDPMGNPHLFPYHPGQVPYMPTNMQNGGYPFPNGAYGGAPPGYNQFYPQLNFDKFQNSIMTPYGEDPNKSNYLPRNTLNDVASNLVDKFSSERNSPENSSSSSYLPYNPFKRRTNRLMDITNRENIVREPNAFSHKYHQGHSMIRKADDAFTFIKKSKYNEDDVEIFMKPKLNLTHNRNRSWSPSRKERSLSPAYSRERDSFIEAPIRNTAKSIYNCTIRVNAMVQIDNQTKKEVCVQIFEKSTVDDLKLKIIESLRYSHILKPEAFEDIDKVVKPSKLLHQNKVIGNDRHLDDMRLQDGSTVELQIPKIYEQELDASRQHTSGRSRVFESQNIQISPFNMESEQQQQSYNRGTVELFNHPPKLTNPEYHTAPSIEELSRMPDEELAKVDGFSVWNQFGKVEFLGRVDIRGIDLDTVISIGHRLVEVYPERNFPTEDSKPVRGEKLNRPALISLYQCFPVNFKCESTDPEERRQELIKKYERQAIRNGYEFVDYDYENGVYRIRVKNF